MKHASPILAILALLAFGCATKPQTSFYLVPDPEGHVGEVTLKNKVGAATLNQANQTIAAPREDKAFSASRQATTQEIQTKFGDALAVMPPPPKGFNIYFDSDSSKLKPEAKTILGQVLAEIKRRDSRDISINGHTDRAGDATANMRLSLTRANSVKDYLVKEGISPEDFFIEYYGESKPVVPTADNVHEPKNRRVEVVVR